MRVALAIILCAAASIVAAGFDRADAGQQLIPSPYPEVLGPGAQIGGGSARDVGGHQRLIPDPVPQSLGPNSLGNPRTSHRHRHQHLLPTPYWRQYHQWR